MNIPLIRSLNQQLISPQFKTPEEVLAWMGMIQAQNFGAAKQALAMRLKCTSPEKAMSLVEDALDRGTIIRTHVMRPTWQLVLAGNVRWMSDISRERNRRAYEGYIRQSGLEINAEEYEFAFKLIMQLLSGGKSMTVEELMAAFAQHSPVDREHLKAYI